jgi:hypothetical protein
MDATSTNLREILEEIRAQGQAIFTLIDRKGRSAAVNWWNEPKGCLRRGPPEG